MLNNSWKFAYKRGIEAFNLLFNLLALNKPKAVMVCIDSFKLQIMTAFNKKLLRGVQGGGFLEKSPPGRRRHKNVL
jgi:hypothetical protein